MEDAAKTKGPYRPEPNPDGLKESDYPDEITLRAWNVDKKWFFDARKVKAKRTMLGGHVAFDLHPRHVAGNTTPYVGSEITDAEGTVWVVTQHLGKMGLVEKKK